MTEPAAPAPDRVVKHFRTSPAAWDTFLAATPDGEASTVLRRLAVLYSRDAKLRAKVSRTADPAPDRRYVKA